MINYLKLTAFCAFALFGLFVAASCGSGKYTTPPKKQGPPLTYLTPHIYKLQDGEVTCYMYSGYGISCLVLPDRKLK